MNKIDFCKSSFIILASSHVLFEHLLFQVHVPGFWDTVRTWHARHWSAWTPYWAAAPAAWARCQQGGALPAAPPLPPARGHPHAARRAAEHPVPHEPARRQQYAVSARPAPQAHPVPPRRPRPGALLPAGRRPRSSSLLHRWQGRQVLKSEFFFVEN